MSVYRLLPMAVRFRLESRSPDWATVRRKHLDKNPKCAACGGSQQLEVHHLLPFHLYPELELVPENLLTLCERRGCHLRIGHSFNWSAYNAHCIADAALQLDRIQYRVTSRLAA